MPDPLVEEWLVDVQQERWRSSANLPHDASPERDQVAKVGRPLERVNVRPVDGRFSQGDLLDRQWTVRLAA